VSRSQSKVVFVRGLEAASIDKVTGVEKDIVLGKIDFQDSAARDMIVGMTLADRLGIVTGDSVLMISPSGSQRALLGFGAPIVRSFRVAAIYESNNKDYDANYAYISISAAQELFNMENKYSGIELRLKDFQSADKVKAELTGDLPGDVIVSSWFDLHKNLYIVMSVERWSAYILLCLIIVVATFNMLGSLTMGVIEKQRDIAVLKSMGMTASRITRVFMAEGMFIGFIGTVLGIGIGLGVLLLQMKYQIFPLDTTVYIIPAIPVEIRWTDFLAIGIASLGCSFLAAYYPARRAASTLPAQALRWE